MPFALLFAQTQLPSNMSSSGLIVYLIVALVIDVAIAFGCGKLLQEAGYSFWLGFLMGFFCGIFGLIVAVALYFTSQNRVQRRAPMPPMDQYGYGASILPPAPMDYGYQQGACTQCHAPVPPGSEFCPNCGNYVAQQPYAQQPYQQQPYPTQPYPEPPPAPHAAPPQQPALPGSAAPPPGSMKVCPLCSSKVPASHPTCTNCGTDLGGTSAW